MLAKGEVDEIIVRPDVEMVSIVLNEGAIVKGRRINVSCFTISQHFVNGDNYPPFLIFCSQNIKPFI